MHAFVHVPIVFITLIFRYVICSGFRTNGKQVHDYLYYINERICTYTIGMNMDILQVRVFITLILDKCFT